MEPQHQFDQLAITDDSIREYDGDRIVKRVEKPAVESVEVAHGLESASPAGLITVGAVFIGIALFTVKGLLISVFTEGGQAGKLSSAALILFPLGLWCIVSALRKRLLLIVHCRSGEKQKFAFSKNVNREAAKTFVRERTADSEIPVKFSV